MTDTALVTEELKQRWRQAAVYAARELADTGVVDTGVVFDASVDAAAQLVVQEVVRSLESEIRWLEREFPRYEMVIDGKSHWLPMHQAGPAYDNGWVHVRIGKKVIERDGTERSMTKEDFRSISDAADEHSASK